MSLTKGPGLNDFQVVSINIIMCMYKDLMEDSLESRLNSPKFVPRFSLGRAWERG